MEKQSYNLTNSIEMSMQMGSGDEEMDMKKREQKRMLRSEFSILMDIGIGVARQDIWRFVKMESVSKNTFIYHFRSDEYQVVNWMRGTKWLGRHFTLSFIGEKHPVRLYTTIQAYSEMNQR